MGPVVNVEELIKEYENGASMNYLANTFGTYPTTIKRILEKNGVTLRHDYRKKGELYVEEGEKLIKWAKAQKRLVTKSELAEVIGTKKLSPSYFEKYPELGQYVKTNSQKELNLYTNMLYEWLQKNNIPYKPNDRTKLKVSVSALLLEKYSNIILQIAVKPTYVSKKTHSEAMINRKNRAHEKDMKIIFLYEDDFEYLDNLKKLLED